MRKILQALLCMPLLLPCAGLASVIYVNSCKPPTGPRDGTFDHPFDALGNAVTVAPSGSTVVVSNDAPFWTSSHPGDSALWRGTYPETGRLPLTLQKPLTLTATGGAVTIGGRASTEKVWQMTGAWDLERNTPTWTTNDIGLAGTDLGASVEHNGRIYFLFGDTIPSGPNTSDRPMNGDSIASVPANANPEQHTPLEFVLAPDGKYLSPKIKTNQNCDVTSDISVGAFEVPTGAFSVGGQMYVFYSTCWNEDALNPVMGRTVLARLDPEQNNCFTYLYAVSTQSCGGIQQDGKFINVAPVVVNNADIPGLPRINGQGVLLWGTGLYRKSDVYLAYLPVDGIADPDNLLYWCGDNLRWRTLEALAVPLLHLPDVDRLVGELSVAWNPFLRKWLMLYNSATPPWVDEKTIWRGINYRLADLPWGEWSPPRILFDPNCDRGYCHFMHVQGCDANYDNLQAPGEDRLGGEYAPYLIPRFTRGDANTTTIYWTMSTWNPYQVMLMKSTLRLPDGQRPY